MGWVRVERAPQRLRKRLEGNARAERGAGMEVQCFEQQPSWRASASNHREMPTHQVGFGCEAQTAEEARAHHGTRPLSRANLVSAARTASASDILRPDDA